MMKLRETVGVVAVMGDLLLALLSCLKRKGAAECAGKEADKAADLVGQQIEKAGERF